MGYHRAGFDVDGVDLADRPRYPFPAHRGDALEHLTHLIETGEIEQYALVHASPPCQNKCGLTVGTNRSRGWGGEHVDLVGPTRDLLDRTCLPYVIEQPNGQAVVEQNGCGYGQRAAHRPEVGADHVPGVRRTLAQSADLGPDVSGIGELSDPVARTAVPRPAASRLFQARAHPRVAGLPATSYRRVIFSSVSAILNAAVDDEYMRKNPCSASTVRAPPATLRRLRPGHRNESSPRRPLCLSSTAPWWTSVRGAVPARVRPSDWQRRRSDSARAGCTSDAESRW